MESAREKKTSELVSLHWWISTAIVFSPGTSASAGMTSVSRRGAVAPALSWYCRFRVIIESPQPATRSPLT
ncbi:Uncharacterised protein [Mycobacteroides abscessus]|nr:Uncharacterised protein [Mycobacteroides abscessus]